MNSKKLSTVEDYLISLDSTREKTLRGVIEFILRTFPDLDSRLAWNVPQICRGKEYVFGVSSSKKHLALAPWSVEVMENFKTKLEGEGYIVKKNLFQVPIDWKIDGELLIDLVTARLTELD